VGREATYRVIEDLRPGQTDTVCLSLLTMGDEEARRQVTELPVITIDGCPKACARSNVTASGGRPRVELRVVDTYRENRALKVDLVSDLGEKGRQLARILADKVVSEVDRLLEESEDLGSHA
jgi:uncharacterized metal-binding protein